MKDTMEQWQDGIQRGSIMVSILTILRRLAESRGTSDRYWQDKRRRMEDERARRERQRQLEQLIKRRRRREALLGLEQLETQPLNPTLTNVPINEIFGFEPKKRRRS